MTWGWKSLFPTDEKAVHEDDSNRCFIFFPCVLRNDLDLIS